MASHNATALASGRTWDSTRGIRVAFRVVNGSLGEFYLKPSITEPVFFAMSDGSQIVARPIKHGRSGRIRIRQVSPARSGANT
jgi:hypothetical protein